MRIPPSTTVLSYLPICHSEMRNKCTVVRHGEGWSADHGRARGFEAVAALKLGAQETNDWHGMSHAHELVS